MKSNQKNIQLAESTFLTRFKRSFLRKTDNFSSGLVRLFKSQVINHDLFKTLEEKLLVSDFGVNTTQKIVSNLIKKANCSQLKNAEILYELLAEEMSEILLRVESTLDFEKQKPFIILVVGVNGVGKTTTIGKLAYQFRKRNKSVMLAAGDTFRAAAIEQLQILGEINRVPVIMQHTGADSASVIFDSVKSAKSRNMDILIADTAGRLQNKRHLMKELEKIVRVVKKIDKDFPHEIMLIIDANSGQNAINQTKIFHETIGLTGITLTKLDGTAKGGVIFSIADQFRIPIRYVSIGEKIEDLHIFKSSDFIKTFFSHKNF